MKKIITIVCFIIWTTNGVQASEIIGRISTDPENVNAISENPSLEEVVAEQLPQAAGNSAGSYFLPIEVEPKDVINDEGPQDQNIPEEEKEGDRDFDIKVLGVSFYPDGTLLRGSDYRIYLIDGQTKKYIRSMKELQKYSGQETIDVDDEEIERFLEWRRKNGELIRQIGEEEVFVIENGKKVHILNLNELRNKHGGKEIFNIRKEEMMRYST